ncbi:hypothetical protein RASY3_01050 [Ruminococcus albus SY3]|uniref:Uncharacterized protein n=1 Tax=Ruminococcus albus SY3 TaxID=1341156 RepID=A0A011WV95_RUMAL|nr:hypothetical protein RASY3_01050 [Ruminococcus albus SY3]
MGQAFRERLEGSTRGRASRSRRKNNVATIPKIADYLHTKKCAGIPNHTSVYQTIPPAQTKSVNYARARNRTATATADAVAVNRFLDL